MLKVGVTGGIGSGKSLVCKIFAALGVPIYYADDRAKWLMVNNPTLKKQIQSAFGEESYLPDLALNRGYLAQKIFNNPEQLHKLNTLVHPAVGKDFDEFINLNKEKPYLIKEAALIFESGAYKNLDYVINVYAPEEERITRVLKRDIQRDKEQVRAIINKQLRDEERAKLADFEIKNHDKHLVSPQVLHLHKKFLTH